MRFARLFALPASALAALGILVAPLAAQPTPSQKYTWNLDPVVLNPNHTSVNQNLGAGSWYAITDLTDAGVIFHKDQQSSANTWHWEFDVFWTPPPTTIIEGTPSTSDFTRAPVGVSRLGESTSARSTSGIATSPR